jgi:hypothetical protein
MKKIFNNYFILFLSLLYCHVASLKGKKHSSERASFASKVFYYGSCGVLVGLAAGICFLKLENLYEKLLFFYRSPRTNSFFNNTNQSTSNFIDENIALFRECWDSCECDNFTHNVLNFSELEKVLKEKAGENEQHQAAVGILMRKIIEYYEMTKINKAASIVCDLETMKPKYLAESKYSRGDYDYQSILERYTIEGALKKVYKGITGNTEVSQEVCDRLKKQYIELLAVKGISFNAFSSTPKRMGLCLIDL